MKFVGTNGSVDNLNDATIGTWFNNLVQAPQVVTNNISLVFGEQLRDTQNYTLPLIVLYLKEMTFSDALYDGNFVNSDPFVQRQWGVKQRVRCDIWNESPSPNAGFLDHVNSVILTMSNLIQALYWQLPIGLKFRMLRAEMSTDSKFQYTRFGQSLRVDFEITLPISYTPPDYEQVTSTTIDVEIDDDPDAGDPGDDVDS